MAFKGFTEINTSPIRIPEQFFRQVLDGIDDINELKLTLHIFWYLDRMESPLHYTSVNELIEDGHFIQTLGDEPGAPREVLETSLQKAVKRGTLLQAEFIDKNGPDKIICLNSPKGRALVNAIQRGEWKGKDRTHEALDVYTEHPNIFQLYESNIGPLTPMIADALRDAEKSYQAEWIEDAFHIAVEGNKRNWRYIEAILRRWQEGGRDDRKDQQNRRDTEEARRRYGEWEK